MIIRFNRRRFLLTFLPILILMGISLVINPDQWLHGSALWILGIFGAFLIVSLLVMPSRYFLQLQPQGLTVQNLIGRKFYSWNEVRDFRVIHMYGNFIPIGTVVGFDLTPDSPHLTMISKMAKVSRRVHMFGKRGYNVSIYAVFDLSAYEIANLLNEWQQRYAYH